jgi:hypothetical protein
MLEPANGSWTIYTTSNSKLVSDSIYSLAIDAQDQIWIDAFQELIKVTPDGTWTTYPIPDSETPGQYVTALATDKTGQVWVASSSSGLSRLTPGGSWKTYSPADYGFDPNDAYKTRVVAVAIDNQDRPWVGTVNGRISQLAANDQWTIYSPDNSGRPTDLNSLAIDQQGRVWVGHTYGLGVLNNNTGISSRIVAILVAIRAGLIGLGLLAFGLMLIVAAIIDQTPDSRVLRFVIGFIGLPVLNAVLVLLLIVISRAMPSCNGFGDCLGSGLVGLALLGLVNIGIVIVLGVIKRWWILLGMAAAFVIVCALYVALFGPHL